MGCVTDGIEVGTEEVGCRYGVMASGRVGMTPGVVDAVGALAEGSREKMSPKSAAMPTAIRCPIRLSGRCVDTELARIGR